MKVTLIYPGITECGFNSLKGNEGSWMNHGLAIISSVLRSSGHDVDLIDLRRLTGWGHYRRIAQEAAGEVVGITMMSVDYNPGVKAAQIMKQVRPEARIFVGGPHAAICPEKLERLDCIDCVVRGEAEITFPKLLDDLAAGRPIGKVVQGERLENLDDSPWADRDLFDCPEEPFVPFLKPAFVTLIAGRGCRYNCNYCQPAERKMFGHKVRRRSVENVIEELKTLRDRYAFNSWMLHDDCLTEDRPWVIEFCRRYKEEGFTQPFVVQSRADIICNNPDMVEALYDAGLRLCIIGFESGSDRVLKFLRKGCTRKQNLKAAGICRRLGIKIWANYMLGLPTETKEEVLETVSMLEEIRPYHCSPAFYTPHPGSDLFEMGKEQGLHLITTHDSYRRNTYEPKIKGPDYEFLHTVLSRTIALAEVNRPVAAQPNETAAAEKITFSQKTRNRLKASLMRFPRFYRALNRTKRNGFIRRVTNRK